MQIRLFPRIFSSLKIGEPPVILYPEGIASYVRSVEYTKFAYHFARSSNAKWFHSLFIYRNCDTYIVFSYFNTRFIMIFCYDSIRCISLFVFIELFFTERSLKNKQAHESAYILLRYAVTSISS